MVEKWYTLSSAELLSKLNSSRSGLSGSQASERLGTYGFNQLQRKKKATPLVVFLRQFLSPLIYVLVVAAVISLVVEHYMDASVIFGVLILNAVIGYLQEQRAEKAMEALMQMAAPHSKVRRDGKVTQVPSREIVPGDIILLEAGDRVPADGRLIEVHNLKVNESPLTGESMPVDKSTSDIRQETEIADRKNSVFMGTVVSYGRATAVAVETGMQTEIGKIASAIQEVKAEKTPLQESISKLSKTIVFIFIGICVLLVVVGVIQGLEWLEVFLLAVAAAVSAIPEGLPAVVTVVLALGMRIMANRNAIIRKLVAVETLGSATVICTDKTGTLTLNQMTVRKLYVDGDWIAVSGEGYEPKGQFFRGDHAIYPEEHTPLMQLLKAGLLCNDALLSSEEDCCSIFGDPTEGALVVLAAKAGMEKEKVQRAFPRIDEVPFQSEKQYMATLHPREGGNVAYIKGAVEKLLPRSNYIMQGNEVAPLDDAVRTKIGEANAAMAGDAMRVMGIAYLEFPGDYQDLRDEDIRDNLVFVGLAGMADPPRTEAKQSIALCKQAGIKVVMITGDNSITAQSIASQLDLPPGKALTGSELTRISDDQFATEVENISVFARIEPLQKLRIVDAFKQRGYIVAMTGDGVNDAPALKSADIGISMGITGTDVAKEASDMILADDNFSSIVAAIDEGRAIFNRLRNVIFFLLSTNTGELLALIFSLAFVGQAPLLAVQIIWVNLVTDTASAIPLGLEPKAGDELKQPARHPGVGLLYPGLLIRVGFFAAMMAVGVVLIFNWALNQGWSIEEARTLSFCSLVAFEWFRAFNARADETTVFRLGIFKNRWLMVTITVAILLQIAVVYTPFLQQAFGTVPLDLRRWGIAVGAGASLFTIEEIRKLLFPRLFSAGKWIPVSFGRKKN